MGGLQVRVWTVVFLLIFLCPDFLTVALSGLDIDARGASRLCWWGVGGVGGGSSSLGMYTLSVLKRPVVTCWFST